MKLANKLFYIIVLFALSGCKLDILKSSETPEVYKLPPEGLSEKGLPATTIIDPGDIKIYKFHNDIDDIEFVVLQTRTNYEEDKYYRFMKQSLLAIGFKQVFSVSEFSTYLNDGKLNDNPFHLYDLNSSHSVYIETGSRFLVITAKLSTRMGDIENYISVIDPKLPEVLIELNEEKMLWDDLDSYVNYPTVNLINNWYQGKPQPLKR